jgi:hypothetical protein
VGARAATPAATRSRPPSSFYEVYRRARDDPDYQEQRPSTRPDTADGGCTADVRLTTGGDGPFAAAAPARGLSATLMQRCSNRGRLTADADATLHQPWPAGGGR